jgi:hypothetical protein
MKKFEELNYYEILEISFDASASEVEIAYKNALSMYNEDSLLTYSLFMNDERERVLKKIEEAYYTLHDTSRRKAYNATLKRNLVLSNDQTQTDKNSLSFCNDNNNMGDAIESANRSNTRYSTDSPTDISPDNSNDKDISEDSSQTMHTEIASDSYRNQKPNQERSSLSKLLRKSLYLLVVVAGLLLFLLVVSYGTFTSWDFLKKFYSGPSDDRSRIEAGEPEEFVQVAELEKEKERLARVSGNLEKKRTREMETVSPKRKTSEMYITLVSSANIRSGPDMHSKVIMQTYRGEELDVSGKSGEWLMLKLQDDSTGWIHHSLAEKK